MSEERLAPVQGYSAGIPWSMHLRAYDAYCELHGKQQALIEGHCRGGFGVNELDMFIPGWREELSELHRLRTSLAAAERELKEIKEDVVEHVHDGGPFNWTEAVIIIREERAKAAAVRTVEAERDKWEAVYTCGHKPDCPGVNRDEGYCGCGFTQMEAAHVYIERIEAERDEWQRRASEAEKSVHDMKQHVDLAKRKAAASWAAAVAAAKAKVESLGGWELSYGSMDAEPDGRYLERQDVLAGLASLVPPGADQPAGAG